jgi:hypothetical protein
MEEFLPGSLLTRQSGQYLGTDGDGALFRNDRSNARRLYGGTRQELTL